MKQKISLTESQFIDFIKKVILESTNDLNTIEGFLKSLKEELRFNVKEQWGDAYFRRTLGKNVIEVNITSEPSGKAFEVEYFFYIDKNNQNLNELADSIINDIDTANSGRGYERRVNFKKNVKFNIIEVEFYDYMLPSENFYNFIKSQIEKINSTTI